jgi:hypothetical protein
VSRGRHPAPESSGLPGLAPIPRGLPGLAPVPRGRPGLAPIPRGRPGLAPIPRGRPGLAPVVAALLVATVAGAGSRWARPVRVDAAGARHGPVAPWPDMRIELNSVGAGTLTLLPGVGETLAERIVRDRIARGPFASLEDLQRVDGVGPATVARIRPHAVVDPAGASGELRDLGRSRRELPG